MLNIFIFSAVIVIIAFVSDRVFTKKYNIMKETGFYTHVNNSHKWGEALILFISLVLLFIHAILLDITGPLKPSHYFLAIIPSTFFRIFMEYRYEKDSKRYIRSMLSAILIITCFVGFELIL